MRTARTGAESHSPLMEHMEALESPIQEAKTEAEQEWAVFVIPNIALDYNDYDGAQVPVNNHMAIDKFKLQIGLSPLEFYQSSKNPHVMKRRRSPAA